MSEKVITLIDTRGVQNYIFGSNKLSQHIGASYLAHVATHDWIVDVLKSLALGIDTISLDYLDHQPCIEDEGVQAELLYIGGGNASLLFANMDAAVAFTRAYTQKLLIAAPGFEVSIAHMPFIWESDMRVVWQELQHKMHLKKEQLLPSQPIQGLSVTAQCVYTGRPAVAEKDGVLISEEVAQKLRFTKVGRERLSQQLKVDGELKDLKYPERFDDLAHEKGRFSYIAVVHADGNSMGNRIKAYLQAENSVSPRAWIKKLRCFSQAVNTCGKQAIQAVVSFLDQHSHRNEYGQTTIYSQIGNTTKDILLLDGQYMPIIPIVFGGDDITFVCNGRLGLTLAAKLLQAFSAHTLPDGEPAYACAGVALVHAHYPFAQAYRLAEGLCQSAKDDLRRLNAHASALNWHFATSGVLGTWKEIQRREYTFMENEVERSLNLRPIFLTKVQGNHWRSWEAFVSIFDHFRQKAATERNKLKDFRLAMRSGQQATREFLVKYELLDGLDVTLDISPEDNKLGWHQQKCLYFDAIEADDFFLRLE